MPMSSLWRSCSMECINFITQGFCHFRATSALDIPVNGAGVAQSGNYRIKDIGKKLKIHLYIHIYVKLN